MDRILVGVEESPHARLAAQFAIELASRTRAELTFLHVLPTVPWPAPLDPEDGLARWKREQRDAGQLLERLEESCKESGIESIGTLACGTAAEELASAARAPEVSFLVVGAPRSGPVSSALLGSVAQKLLQTCEHPVIVVPKGELPVPCPAPGRCILVGVDGSRESLAAVRVAVGLAKSTGASLLFACAVGTDSAAQLSRENANVALRAAEAVAAEEHLTAALARPAGAAALALCELARREDVALVVAGHRGRGAMARMLMGSVADRLARECPKPLLVVRDASSAG